MNDQVPHEKPFTAFDVVSLILGQIPAGLIYSGFEKFSIYQPSFYRGKELFLLIPLLIGAFTTWIVMRTHRAMYWVFPIGISLGITNFIIFESVPLESNLHTANWILSYCTFSLVAAVIARVAGELLGLKKV